MVSDAGRGPSLPANHPFRVARANPRIPQPPAPSVAQHNRPRGLARHEGSRRRDAGAYSATAGLCSPRRPARVSSRALRPSGTSRSGGRLSSPAFGDFEPGPRSGSATRLGSTPQAHRGTPYSLVLRPVATHDIAAARATASGRGLLDLTPPTGFLPGADRCHVRCWIQTPRREQRREHHDTAQSPGEKLHRGKPHCRHPGAASARQGARD